jgi:hypothetical protein
MPAVTDRIQFQVNLGDVVNIPCVVTAIGGTVAAPTLTLTTKYANFSGSTGAPSGTMDAIQVIKDK